MTDLTAVDIMIQPDATAIARAREVNRRMPLTIRAGITLDDTHLPHITMLQRYLITADLDQAYAALAAVVADTDLAHPCSSRPGDHLLRALGPARAGRRRPRCPPQSAGPRPASRPAGGRRTVHRNRRH
jgi:hypothetical protein